MFYFYEMNEINNYTLSAQQHSDLFLLYTVNSPYSVDNSPRDAKIKTSESYKTVPVTQPWLRGLDLLNLV